MVKVLLYGDVVVWNCQWFMREYTDHVMFSLFDRSYLSFMLFDYLVGLYSSGHGGPAMDHKGVVYNIACIVCFILLFCSLMGCAVVIVIWWLSFYDEVLLYYLYISLFMSFFLWLLVSIDSFAC